MNFGTILESVSSECVTLVTEGKSSTATQKAKKFIQFIQLKEVLRKQFKLYSIIKESSFDNEDDARLFIHEAFRLLDKYSFEDIQAYNALLETKFKVKKIKPQQIDLAIADIIRYRTSDATIKESTVKNHRIILNHLLENKTIPAEPVSVESYHQEFSALKYLKPKHVFKRAIIKFNEELRRNFNKSDMVLLEVIRRGDAVEAKSLFESKLKKIDEELNRVEMTDKLKETVMAARDKISTYSIDNLYSAHELVSELEKL